MLRRTFVVIGLVLCLLAVVGLLESSSASAGANVWTPLGGPIITGGDVAALDAHPTVSGTVYAVANSPGSETVYWGQLGKVFKTTNGAATWAAVYTPEIRLQSLALTGTLVYAGGWGHARASSVYRSDDRGVIWDGVYTTTSSWNAVYALAVDPVTTSIVYAAGMEASGADPYAYDGVVHRSTDGGVNWTCTLTVPNYASFYSLAVNPVTPTITLAGGLGSDAGFIYRSEDGGLDWTRVHTTSPGYNYITSLAFHPLTPTVAYALRGWPGMACTLCRSEDAGLTWSSVLADAAGPFVLEPPNTVYVAQASGKIARSTDGGDSWVEMGDPPGGVQSLAIDVASTPPTLYVGPYQRGVYTSTDSGVNWTEANNGLEIPLLPRAITVDPKRPDYLYTAGGYPGGFRSTDGGGTWQQLQGVPYLYAFAVHPFTTSIVYAGGDCDCCATIYRSADSGVSWTGVYTAPVIAEGGEQAIYVLAIDPLAPTNIYACGVDRPQQGASQEGVILRSAGGGSAGTWTRVYTVTTRSRGFEVLAINPVTTSMVYAAAEDCSGGYPCIGTLYRTTNDGQNWTAVLTSSRVFRSLVIDHWRPDLVYAADEGYTVYKSMDGGDNWSVILEMPQQEGDPSSGYLLAVDPRVPTYLYLAGMGSVGRSTDGGSTWENLNAGLPWSLNPTALALDSSTISQTLYLGANGVWTYSQAWSGSIVYLPLALRSHPS